MSDLCALAGARFWHWAAPSVDFAQAMALQSDSVATIEFELRDDAGVLLEASPPGHPLVFLMGRRTLFPALEEALIGLEPGEELVAKLPPNEAYGFPDERLVQRIPRARFEGDVAVGMQFEARNEAGRRHVARVLAVEAEDVLLDANHPLAGRTLHVVVRLLDARPASPEELAHGHAHAPGTHHH